MRPALEVWVQGLGFWAPGIADWPAFVGWLDGVTPTDACTRPQADTLPPNERRRAPESVLLAVAAAGQAMAASGLDPTEVASVFSSAHGDQAITDYMCATLAEAPAELSPIRFHNSVHNAPAGYWTIATVCHAASSAISAGAFSFGAGLLEAATQAIANEMPVLLVAFDTAGHGALQAMTRSRTAFAAAMVLTPTRTERSQVRLGIATTAATAAPTAPRDSRLAGWIADNPSAAGIPLLENIARAEHFVCTLAAARGLHLRIDGEKLI